MFEKGRPTFFFTTKASIKESRLEVKLKDTVHLVYQSSLGIVVETAYSFAIIIAAIGIICLVKTIQWFLSLL